MKNKKGNWKIWAFFWIFLILCLIFNFIRESFGISHFSWHAFLHLAVVVFSFLILIHSLKLNEKATKYIVSGCLIWIITHAVLFLSHVFEEYTFLQTNLFTFLGGVVGVFIIMFGFKEAVE